MYRMSWCDIICPSNARDADVVAIHPLSPIVLYSTLVTHCNHCDVTPMLNRQTSLSSHVIMRVMQNQSYDTMQMSYCPALAGYIVSYSAFCHDLQDLFSLSFRTTENTIQSYAYNRKTSSCVSALGDLGDRLPLTC